MSNLTPVAEQVAQSRYFMRDKEGNATEDWEGLSHRVVNYVCKDETDEFKDNAFNLIYNTEFLPNSPCLVNAGRGNKKSGSGLMACFVSKDPEDSWVGMIDNIANFGHICRQGGGCGVSFSKIRPEGDPVFGSTHAKACGPIEHIRMISEVMHSITQSGFRSMAMMATLDISHPNIEEFIICKQRERALKTLLREDISGHYELLHNNPHPQLNIILDKFISNFNISVFVSDEFMQKVENGDSFELKFNDRVYKTVDARNLFQLIVHNAWKNGDPGILFGDTINAGPYKYSGQVITATNPCSEQPLPSWGSCNLGSIDVSKYVVNNDIDWNRLYKSIHTSIQFLDDVIDANHFPTKQFWQWAQENRPVGLGIMGLADLFLKLKIAYGSKKSLSLSEKLISFFQQESHKKSVLLAKERGTPKCCRYQELEHRRNITTLTIAPTGSISLLAGCSGAIEPIFSPTVYRLDNTGKYEMSHPESGNNYFRCAIDPEKRREVTWEQHVAIQSVFQKHIESSLSKTINMPSNATEKDVAKAYIMAWKLGCKGICVYRDGSKTIQVLNANKTPINEVQASTRPKELECDIYKTKADGYDWHIMIGKLYSMPYELFAVNGRMDLPTQGRIVKRKKRHYSLFGTNGDLLIDNLAEEESHIDPKISLETRRFSLELRHGVPTRYIVQQIDKSNDYLNSFSKATARIIKKHYLTVEDHLMIAEEIICPLCKSEMVCQSGCWMCPEPECGYAKCG